LLQGYGILVSSGLKMMYLPAAGTVTSQVDGTWIAGGTTFQPMLGLKLLLSSALTTGTRQSCPTETRCQIYETPFWPKNYLDDVIKMLDYGL
jgi:hypothetical protein